MMNTRIEYCWTRHNFEITPPIFVFTFLLETHRNIETLCCILKLLEQFQLFQRQMCFYVDFHSCSIAIHMQIGVARQM